VDDKVTEITCCLELVLEVSPDTSADTASTAWLIAVSTIGWSKHDHSSMRHA